MPKIFAIIFVVLLTSILNAQSNNKRMSLDILTSHDYVFFTRTLEGYYDGGGWGPGMYTTLNGKYGFGAGVRVNYLQSKRISPFLGLFVVDKGYRIRHSLENDVSSNDYRGRTQVVYQSTSIGVTLKLSTQTDPFYFFPGLMADILLFKHHDLNRFNYSIMLGFGKGFNIGEKLKIVVEPNIKIPVKSYGGIHLERYENDSYDPFSVGINLGISR